MPGYIPTRDADLVPWADNFADLILADPARYGLTAGDATTIDGLRDAWNTAYALAINPVTRTPATIAGKDSAKGAMVPILRLYAQTIKINVGVTNEDKVALGIHINDTGPTPVPVPTSLPKIAITSMFHLNMLLDIRANETPTSRAKPPGAAGAVIFTTLTNLSDPAPTNPELADFRDLGTRNLINVEFGAGDVGKRCTYWCRWFNAKGERGPWSNPLSQVVA